MLPFKDARGKYYEATGCVSDRVRQLSLAGIGVVWILRVGKDAGGIRFDPLLLRVLQMFVVTLAADFLQYVTQAVIWGVYSYLKEDSGSKPDDLLYPPETINWIPIALFWTKTVCCAFGMWQLLAFLKDQLTTYT